LIAIEKTFYKESTILQGAISENHEKLPTANCLQFLEEEHYETEVPTGKTFSVFFFIFDVSIDIGKEFQSQYERTSVCV
jgi:hypothetical protein